MLFLRKLWLMQCLEAIVDFLKNFKSSSTEAAEQLEGLNLNGDGDSDEYDMVDDVDGANGNRRGQNKLKYMQLLQDVADRKETAIFIDLNDVDAVSRRLRILEKMC